MNHTIFHFDNDTKIGTLGGTLLVVLNLGTGELLKAGILAGFGALVSFLVSLLLKWLVSRKSGKAEGSKGGCE